MEQINWGLDSNKKRQREYADQFDDNIPNKKSIADISSIFKPNEMIYVFDKEIHFTSVINKDSIETMIKKITEINNTYCEYFNKLPRIQTKSLEITYIVDSPGGCVTSVLKFVDFIRICKKKYPYIKFTSIATGLIASAGTIMCIVADRRKMTKNAQAMIHELSSGNGGKYTEIMSYSNYLTHLHNALTQIYLDRSSKSKTELEELLKDETWFTAKEYLKHGFVDEII